MNDAGTFPLRSLVHHSCLCSQGLGIPNAQRSLAFLPSNAVWCFYIRNLQPSPFGKISVYHWNLSESLFLWLVLLIVNQITILPSIPRFNTFFAVFSFSSLWYPQVLQKKFPFCLLPIVPQWLHRLLISFPNTSISSTDCSWHFCVRRFLIYPRCHMVTEWLDRKSVV